jgi:hypothetical protein
MEPIFKLADLLQIELRYKEGNITTMTGSVNIQVPNTAMTFKMQVMGAWGVKGDEAGCGILCHVKGNLYLIITSEYDTNNNEVTILHLIDGNLVIDKLGGGAAPRKNRYNFSTSNMKIQTVMKGFARGIVQSFKFDTLTLKWEVMIC